MQAMIGDAKLERCKGGKGLKGIMVGVIEQVGVEVVALEDGEEAIDWEKVEEDQVNEALMNIAKVISRVRGRDVLERWKVACRLLHWVVWGGEI